MASFEDAGAGWDIYNGLDGGVSRIQLNQSLHAIGLNPISSRTYAHYGKLLRLGYSEYVSINRLDIRHANDSLFDVADRSRYQDRRVDRDARLVVPGASGLLNVVGKVQKVSEGFAVIRVPNSESVAAVPRATKYN